MDFTECVSRNVSFVLKCEWWLMRAFLSEDPLCLLLRTLGGGCLLGMYVLRRIISHYDPHVKLTCILGSTSPTSAGKDRRMRSVCSSP